MASGIIAVRFTSAGGLFTSTVPAGTITLATGGFVKTPKYYEPPELCNKRRGGPRSNVYCEVYAEVHHALHIGRSTRGGNSKYYRWKDDDGFRE